MKAKFNRLGKREKQILRILYDDERVEYKKRRKYYFSKPGYLRPLTIIKRITKKEYPAEKKFNLTPHKKAYYLMWLAQVCSLPKKERENLMENNPQNKLYQKIRKEQAEWRKETNAIYRAIENLFYKGLIWTSKFRQRRGYKTYRLTETGRRVISHRLNPTPITTIKIKKHT